MARFTGKTVIVTGAGSGIGAAIAQRFHDEGANIIVIGRTEDTLREATKGFDDARVAIYAGDVADPAVGEAAVKLAVGRFGGLDVLVNNAATAMGGDVESTSIEDFDTIMATNVRGYFAMAKAAMPALRKTKGSIVMTSSASGRGGDWGMLAYNISKGAVDNMVRAMALDSGRHGVRVNAVSPSLTDTEMSKGIQTDERLAKFMDRIPMRRIGQPDDVAKVVLFLASDAAGFVTGVMIPVDGGLSASNGQPNMRS
ncbi:MAG: SDR family oxidoreductase [Pseudomonadota bacterium]|nr:SDR family oxidoreductase [Pseudomonadota bacterium]